MNRIFLAEEYKKDFKESYIQFPFYKCGKPLNEKSFPKCALTLRSASSMRFRWNEENPAREKILQNIEEKYLRKFVPVELNHTQTVYDVKNEEDSFRKIGDGIITTNENLIPVITVADCVPIYFFEPNHNVFGIVHSGWKGTGIIKNAFMLASQKYGSRVEDFFVMIGPYIHDCCYIVNEERAQYFAKNFGEDCVHPYNADDEKFFWNNGGGKLFSLSLETANVNLLRKIGVKEENITVCSDCTCCTQLPKNGEYPYGSNRRETAITASPNQFTVMAAFILGVSKTSRTI